MKQFKEPNKTQLYYKNVCLENCKKNVSEHFTVSIENEQLFDFNGVLVFFLQVRANENTGTLFLSDKTWFIKIGRRGQVKSTLMHEKKEVEKINKYCIF